MNEELVQDCPECGAVCLVDDGNFVAMASVPYFTPPEHLKGHLSLADMVNTHIHIWREALAIMRDTHGYQACYVDHELKALADIEAACKIEGHL